MSNDSDACNCVYTESLKQVKDFNVSVSNEQKSCCWSFVREYSNTSDFKIVERTNVNSSVMGNYLPVVLRLEVHSKEHKQRTISPHSFYSTKIPILISSLLI
jgi:hypothetical protein